MTRSSLETPMMRQYLSVKSQYPDAVVFFRMVDFYEMFFEDALKVSSILELTKKFEIKCKKKYNYHMKKQKNFLILAILLGLAGITIGSATIFSLLSQFSGE